MIFFYRTLSTLLYPFLIILIFLRKFINKEDVNRYKEKIFPSHFNIDKKIDSNIIWFHAASIGELKSIIPIISELNKKRDDLEFLITTVTLSSSLIAAEEIKKLKGTYHRFFPVDVYFVINKFLISWSPRAIFLVDSEIWPNLISLAKKKKIPIVLINARITKKSFLRWSYFINFGRKIFNSFELCLSSNNETVDYLKRLNAKNIFYEGNLKLINNLNQNEIKNLNKEVLNKRRFWFAASTHRGEEVFCLKTHLIIKRKLKDVITIIAPRHINRVNEIKNLCIKFNLSYQILDKENLINLDKEIIILNSFGVLPSFFKYSKSVFIGKSAIRKLKKVGGQNPLDAANLGCRIYHGPYVYNFNEIYKILNQIKISREISSPEDLARNLILDIQDSSKKIELNSEILSELSQKSLNNNMREINKFLSNEII